MVTDIILGDTYTCHYNIVKTNKKFKFNAQHTLIIFCYLKCVYGQNTDSYYIVKLLIIKKLTDFLQASLNGNASLLLT